MNNLSNAYNFNDLASLNAITTAGQKDEAKALREVANQFESMFIGMMLKSMRDANAVFEEDNPLSSNESKFYRQMFDDQLALSMSQGQGMGLADSIYRQMKDQFDIEEKNASDAKPDKIVPLNDGIKPANQVNPFSTMSPSFDLPQFNGKLNKLVSNLADPVSLTSVTESVQAKAEALKLEISEVNTTQIFTTVPLKSPTTETPIEKESVIKPVSKQKGFETPQAFVDILWPIAQTVGEAMGVEPKAIMAQAALETGWGKHIIHQSNGDNSHNLFGIKADKRWSGDVAKVSTLEYRQGIAKKEVAPFRVYDSYEASLKDYASFIKDGDRYQGAVQAGKSVKGYSEGLQKGGYATDPNYAQKIQRIASGDVLNLAINQVKKG